VYIDNEEESNFDIHDTRENYFTRYSSESNIGVYCAYDENEITYIDYKNTGNKMESYTVSKICVEYGDGSTYTTKNYNCDFALDPKSIYSSKVNIKLTKPFPVLHVYIKKNSENDLVKIDVVLKKRFG
jgi:hypothetical protein